MDIGISCVIHNAMLMIQSILYAKRLNFVVNRSKRLWTDYKGEFFKNMIICRLKCRIWIQSFMLFVNNRLKFPANHDVIRLVMFWLKDWAMIFLFLPLSAFVTQPIHCGCSLLMMCDCKLIWVPSINLNHIPWHRINYASGKTKFRPTERLHLFLDRKMIIYWICIVASVRLLCVCVLTAISSSTRVTLSKGLTFCHNFHHGQVRNCMYLRKLRWTIWSAIRCSWIFLYSRRAK